MITLFLDANIDIGIEDSINPANFSRLVKKQNADSLFKILHWQQKRDLFDGYSIQISGEKEQKIRNMEV